MKTIDRNGIYYTDKIAENTDRLLRDIYSFGVSRACVKVLSSAPVSKAAGIALDSATSALLIESFVKEHDIDLYDFEKEDYESFNDFFTRKFKKGRRVIDPREEALVCPCDGRVTAYPIADSDMFVIKNTVYSVSSLLRDSKLAGKFAGGTAIIIHLTLADPHRYIYPCSGLKSHERRIKGALGVVRPVTNEFAPVYKENSREYCLIRNPFLGDLLQMEVGSLAVGRIRNFEPDKAKIKKGQDKGVFDFGGSAIVILTEGGKAEVCDDLLENTRRGLETKLNMGDVIALGRR